MDTSKPSIGWVEFFPMDNKEARLKRYHTKQGIKETDTVHVVRLKGLNSGTKYGYSIYSQEVLNHEKHRVYYGNVVASMDSQKSFRTADRNRKSLNFAMVNDIHGQSELLGKLVSQCDPKVCSNIE